MKLREDLAKAIEEAHRLASTGTLWPGWDIAVTPVILHGREISYILGHPRPPEGYVEVAPVAGRRTYMGPTFPEMAANTVRVIAGAVSALVAYPEETLIDTDVFARLILHECFHVHQLVALSSVSRPDFRVMERYPEDDPLNNAMSIVENKILCSALREWPPSKASDKVKALAGEFIAVRMARHDYLASKDLGNVCTYEELSEFNEGTPTYIEVKAGKPVSEIIDTLQEANVAGKWASYRRFYATGAAMGLLLDFLLPDWHLRLAQGGCTLQSLIREAVCSQWSGVSGADVSAILRAYDYDAILASEEKSASERQAQIEAMLRELSDGPGVRVEIEIPEGAFTLFNPSRVIVVRPGVKLHPTLSGLRGEGELAVDITRLCLEDGPARRMVVRVPELQVPQDQGSRLTSLSAEGLAISAPKGLEVTKGPDGTYRIRPK